MRASTPPTMASTFICPPSNIGVCACVCVCVFVCLCVCVYVCVCEREREREIQRDYHISKSIGEQRVCERERVIFMHTRALTHTLTHTYTDTDTGTHRDTAHRHIK
jgi:hypothetical protein